MIFELIRFILACIGAYVSTRAVLDFLLGTPATFTPTHTHYRIHTCPHCRTRIKGDPCTPDVDNDSTDDSTYRRIHPKKPPARKPP